MNPGPAISTAETHCCTAGWACRAATRAVASSRGFFFRGLASCMAAVTARSPWAACLGASNTGVKDASASGAAWRKASPRAFRRSRLA